MKTGLALAVLLGFVMVSLLVELAREKGVLLQSLAVAFLALVGLAIVGSAAWFHFADLPRLNVHS